MDLLTHLTTATTTTTHLPIHCIETHTSGEPTRIIISGYPPLSGSTLLRKRADAKTNQDHIRRRLLLEPRGHFDMYGAILIQDTELTRSGEADIGVLFCTNDGYSTMCGHATIALGRVLLDMHDLSVFPNRERVKIDLESKTAALRLHAPCGVVDVIVPVNDDASRSDPSRPISFISVPSFATGISINIPLPPEHRWPELGSRNAVNADFAYGGAFYCLISATELGFANGLLIPDFEAFNRATRLLKAAVNANPDLRTLFAHPEHQDLGFLYSVMIVDSTLGTFARGPRRAETGLCYFADQQVDRSPTGSCVAARVALAYAKGQRKVGEAWTYHSLVSLAYGGKCGFIGTMVDEVERGDKGQTDGYPHVRVRVEGFASYTGFHTFVSEPTDALGNGGFAFEKLGREC
ncbi:Diaminopimelate epimerase-like protein [Teratosphaeria nubilosa]|uniref:trans-L-3-hydroxyproline dehydratase n=1 Tax=Teratosphaeria nubilosa TaxID=161662 RepID=A0A6G1L8P2_9PEZI|nr:Diaminopimelate epimerase-like protein [Teratosphaeria nubilosa]